jgi:hypothetical protein
MGFFASHQTRVPETKAQADPLWDGEEKNGPYPHLGNRLRAFKCEMIEVL